MCKNYFNNKTTTEYGTRNITDFERGLYLAMRNTNDFTDVTIHNEYSTTTYTREDIEKIGRVVVEEQYMDWLMSQGEEVYNAEIERQAQEKADWEAYVAEQCELASKAREEGCSDDAV